MTITSIALFSQSRAVTDAVLRALVEVMPLETEGVVALWKPVYTGLVVPSVRVVTALAELKDSDAPVIFSETIDEPGDEAYHFVKNGLPYSLIWAPAGATGDEITERTAHEAIVEMIVDPACDLYDAERWAVEPGDAFEGVSRWRETPTQGRVKVCAYGGPAWHALGPGPLDSEGICKVAHEIPPGGYGERVGDDGQLHMQPAGMRLPPHKYGHHARRMRRRRRLAARHDGMPETLRDTLPTGVSAVRP